MITNKWLRSKHTNHFIIFTHQFGICFYCYYLASSAGAVEYDDYSECPGYDTKQSEGEAWVNLAFWGTLCTPPLPSLQGLLWLGVVASDRVLSMGQIELICNYAKLNCITLTVFLINCAQTKTVSICYESFEIKLFWHLSV